jgi:hypothetical protein
MHTEPSMIIIMLEQALPDPEMHGKSYSLKDNMRTERLTQDSKDMEIRGFQGEESNCGRATQ